MPGMVRWPPQGLAQREQSASSPTHLSVIGITGSGSPRLYSSSDPRPWIPSKRSDRNFRCTPGKIEYHTRVADVFDPIKRSSVMAAIRSKGNRDTELKLISIFKLHEITGWRRNSPLPGKPDFVFQSTRLAIFVDGCFWHGCPLHGRNPDSNPEYWLPKLARNRARDLAVTRELRRRGWRVLRFWEHDLKNGAKVARRINRAFAAQEKARGA